MTTTCPACGQANEQGEAFCGACGTYLVWDEDPAQATASATSTRSGPPTTAAAAVPAAPAPGAAAAAAPAVAGATAPASSEPAPVGATPPDAPRQTEPGPASSDPGAPGAARTRTAVPPGAPLARPAPRTAEPAEPPPEAGDLVCGSCGAGNVPTRHFCRRCGAALADARVQGRRSWWQRLRHPDPRPSPVAGTRPRGRRRFPTKTVVTVLVLGGLGFAAYQLRDTVGGGVVTVQDRLQGGEVHNPVTVTASSEAPDRPATRLVDGTNDQAWSPAAPGDGVGQTVDFAFDQPFRLVHVVVTGGTSTVQEEYLLGSSPRALDVTVTRADGTTAQHRVTLDDVPGPQRVEVPEDDVAAVRFTIVSTYRATPETSVAVAEVEFRGR
ncbi:zinc ribbon domain-containing protein [Cellulosimicrobium protaetiae]|uniref:Zinc ribbon domain-containing protein n=1 Tax=Cellulosimicrobium protaetiae TaxID=2587808 RepID=A0A6M5U8M2_9MICO|nr:zinc ribbon domain-containing protein [Cellulosimicrobium protaetiae]QJW34867.1 zinc ribbon domain-containing protein [Cellulosimicrobium protaetiae]